MTKIETQVQQLQAALGEEGYSQFIHDEAERLHLERHGDHDGGYDIFAECGNCQK